MQGQRDSVPGQGTLPTTSWVEGEVIVDPHDLALALDAPAGPYTIAVGMYDPSTGERLPVSDVEGNLLGNHLLIDEIEISTE